MEAKIKDYIMSEAKNADLKSVLQDYKVDISRFIVDNSLEFYRQTVDNYKDYELKEFIGKYFDEKQLSNLLINKGYPLLVDKLPSLLDGKIKRFVKNNLNKEEINQIINNTIDNEFEFILGETKAYIANKTIEIGLNSSSKHIIPVLQEVDLKDITMRQMGLLNPREIDVLFNSFAGDLFYKLKLYGVFGFVFGINVWLSIILWMLDWRYSKISSKKDLKMLNNS